MFDLGFLDLMDVVPRLIEVMNARVRGLFISRKMHFSLGNCLVYHWTQI